MVRVSNRYPLESTEKEEQSKLSNEQDFSNDSLNKSIKQIGQLYPCLVNQNGKILDGNHRAEVNQNYEKKIVPTKNRFEELQIRAHAHHRRRVPQEETRALIEEMCEALVKDGTSQAEVASILVKSLPYNENYVRSMIPQIYKNPEKVEAGGLRGAQISEQTVTTQDTTEPPQTSRAFLVDCENCGVTTSEAEKWHGHHLCKNCLPKVLANPEKFLAKLHHEKAEEKKPELKILKPSDFESWKDREARMHPQHSRMEEALLEKFAVNNIRPVTIDRSFPIVAATPDFYFPAHNVAVYVDGEDAHFGRQDKDEQLRSRLEAIYKVKVLSLTYSRYTEAEANRLLEEIKRFLEANQK